MKRIASFVLAVLLILSLCACSLPQAKPAKEPTDELELVEEAAETPEERPIMPEETAPEASEPEALPPEETEAAAEAAAEGTETPAEVLPEEPAAPEEAPIPDAPSEVQPENAEAAEIPEPEQEAPSGNGTAPAGDTSGSSGQGGSGQDSSGGSVTIPEPETGGDLVWIPTHGGTKYHRSARCSNMIDPIQVSRETAIANGFTACKRCY